MNSSDEGPRWGDIYLLAMSGALIQFGGWTYYWKGFQAPGMAVLIMGTVLFTVFWASAIGESTDD